MKNYKEIENTLYGKTLSIKVKKDNGITTKKQRKVNYIVYFGDMQILGLYKLNIRSFLTSNRRIPRGHNEIGLLSLNDASMLANEGEVTIAGKTRLNTKYTITYKIINN